MMKNKTDNPLNCALIIEDNKNCCLLIKEYLQSFYQFNQILTGNELNIFSSLKDYSQLSIIFLNFRIAEKGGSDYMSKLRKKYPKTTVIAITSDNTPERFKKINQFPFDDILLKPIDFSKLNYIISNV